MFSGNPTADNYFATLLNCTPVGRASDSSDGPNIKLVSLVGWEWTLSCLLLGHSGFNLFSFASVF